MHIPDGFLSGAVNATGFAVSAAAVGVALFRANRTFDDRQAPLLGITAAFVFAAQMINFPIAAGTSGHFLGAALSAILLGPLNTMLVFAVVLTFQCLLFADGGLTALGANFLNMGIVGGLTAYTTFSFLRFVTPKTRAGFLLSAAVASWASIVAAAVACAIELAVSGTAPVQVVLPALAGIHVLIGVGEALITVATLSVVLAARPDLVGALERPALARANAETPL